MMRPNDRVIVTFRDGSERHGVIAYQRMAPPTYSVPEVFSVILDGSGHAGTIVPVERCRPEEP